ERLPHIWCEGCGLGTILGCILRAIDELGMNDKNIAFVSGIGCAARSAGYVSFDSMHVTHGRAIPVATGIKVSKPQIKPIIFSGDGDLFAIGGNHFIHAARRNVDMLVVCSNNFNYGMTGGQLSPTTPSVYGSIENPLNLVAFAAACGAVYVARWAIHTPIQLISSVKRALKKRGFSFIEVVNQCPTLYGRYNKLGGAVDMVKQIKKVSEIRNGASPYEAVLDPWKKIILGTFVDIERPEFSEVIRSIVRR
ncbi:MAG: thiamine pyrophosphate-dependent enzyme, partial [Nitrososphaerota archaeon]